MMHIALKVFDGSGVEPVHLEHLGGFRYRVMFSPGFVEGIAAGDEIELLGESGEFCVVRRGGNVAVHLFSPTSLVEFREQLERRVAERLRGTVDGGLDRALVFTIPVSVGFAAIEAFFLDLVSNNQGWQWSYNNVYGRDGVPLAWWATGG